MKKIALSVLALAGVVGFTGCSCNRDGEYTFKYVEVQEGDEVNKYTCEKNEERSGKGDVACIAVAALPSKIEIEGDKVTITAESFGMTTAIDYDAKIENKKLYLKNPATGEWEEFAEFRQNELIFIDETYTFVYKY